MASIPSIQEVRDFFYELYQNCDTELSPAERRGTAKIRHHGATSR